MSTARQALVVGILMVLTCCQGSRPPERKPPEQGRPGVETPVPEASPKAEGQPGACPGTILDGQAMNARGLGGVALTKGKVACGRLFRGGHLGGLTEQGCAEIQRLGIKTVVDLRPRQGRVVECLSGSVEVVSAPLPKPGGSPTEHYLAMLEARDSIVQLFEVLGNEASYPVYLECKVGGHLVSFATALVLTALGADRQAVLEEFRRSAGAGMDLADEGLIAALDAIEKQGGIEAFLASAGVGKEELSTLSARLVATPP